MKHLRTFGLSTFAAPPPATGRWSAGSHPRLCTQPRLTGLQEVRLRLTISTAWQGLPESLSHSRRERMLERAWPISKTPDPSIIARWPHRQEINHRPSTNNSPMAKSIPKIVLLRQANQSEKHIRRVRPRRKTGLLSGYGDLVILADLFWKAR
jgi:hypothetical protein